MGDSGAAKADPPRVAVVGAGFSGIVALKECLAEGLDAVCFDAGSAVGGGWIYQPDVSGPVKSSVYAGTMLNSCRDTSAFADFPFDPARHGDYLTHLQFVEYLRDYADHFGLGKHIRLNTNVLDCVPIEGGRWRVRIQEAAGGEIEELHFDAVLAASGHLSKPLTPDFKGRDDFKGQFLHSHYYRTPGPFEGKRVAFIGLGSSCVDIANEMAPQAKELHVVTRRGGWVLPRFALGKPCEAWDSRASVQWLPESTNQWVMGKLLNLVVGEHPKELKPEHGILEQNPAMNGGFLEKVRCGVIKVHRTDVDRFTESGLVLANGTPLDVDVIISATGYDAFYTPYLPDDAIRTPETPPHTADLYKLVMPPRYPNLFFLGFIELFGPLPPAVEAQARYVASLLSGKVKTPTEKEMMTEIRNRQKHQGKTYIRSQRHAFTSQYIPYIDDLLEPLGAVPTFGKMLGSVFTGNPIRGLKMLSAVWFGVPSSAQWRLFGHGAKPDLGQETVLRIADGKAELSKKEVQLLSTQI